MKKVSVKFLIILLIIALFATCLFACTDAGEPTDEQSSDTTSTTPDTPSNPDTPANPDTPSNPSNPDTPTNPDTPSNPSNPDTPTNPDTPETPDDPVVPVVNMTESYAKARTEFKAVTGIELPALADITVEAFPYQEGATSYELDITAGVTQNTFNTLVAFLDSTLATWTKTGPTVEGEYTNIWYAGTNGRIGITWDAQNTAVYVHAIMGGNQPEQPEQPTVTMTESYRNGRNQFYAIMGIWLPELEDCEDVFSWFNVDEQSLRFDFSGEETSEFFASLKSLLKKSIGEPNHEIQNGIYWEYDATVNGKDAKVNVDVDYSTQNGRYTVSIHGNVRNYYNVTLTAGSGGSVTLKMGSRTFADNVAKVNAGDNLIFTATPDENYQFIGWYDGETLVSENNPYSPYLAPTKNVTIQGRFEELPAASMTESYVAARTNFQTATGLLLPELTSVNGYYMSADKEIDIGGSTAENGATADTLTTVNAALQQQIGVEPTTSNGITTWTYTKIKEGVTYDCTVRSMFQNEGTGGLVVVSYSEQAQEPETNMTENYKNARTAFATITGYTLPELENCELLDSSDLRVDQHLTACFDITGTANDMAVIIETLQGQINEEPTYADEEGTSWYVEVELNGKLYIGNIWTMLDAGEYEGEAYSYVYVNYNVSEVAESYLTGRQNFYTVTGVLLPLFAGVEADEFPYEEGDDSYCFDLTEGDSLGEYVYNDIKSFLDEELSGWTVTGPTTSGPYTEIKYTGSERWISVTWDDDNQNVYINTAINTNPDNPNDDPASQMTQSYAAGRTSFYEISGIMLPEIENIELDDTSSFDTEKKVAQLIVPSNADTFTSIVNAVKTALQSEPLSDNYNHWEADGFMAFWEWDYEDGGRMHKVTIQLENNTYTGKITAGYWFRDYYTITLTTTEGGSATLEISGNGQENNTAHVCYNTSSYLYAEASQGYEFIGFYDGETLLSEVSPLEGYHIIKDVTIEARFQEIPSNMDAGYAEARNVLYQMSGIELPELENATTSNVMIEPDEEEGLRDEFQCEFVFETAEEASEAYESFRTAITAVEGNPTETSNNEHGAMDIWSPLYENVTVPYRDDVMMHIQAGNTSFFLMWRKQPIVFYYVEVEGPGNAYCVYTGSDYQDHYVDRYWEIADAFAGKVVAVANEGAEFTGWYVDDELVSTDATYRFSYYNQTVNFTEITFVATFAEIEEPEIEMTESYAQARQVFQTASGLLLPELEEVGGMCEDLGANMWMVDISNATQETLTSVMAAFDEQTGTTSTIDEFGKNVWEYDNRELSCFYEENMVVIMYEQKQMTDSYAAARQSYLDLTGLLLPALSGVEAETSPYTPGASSGLEVDINSDATTDMFDTIVAFFDGLDGWEKQAPMIDGEYINQFYTSDAGMIGATWDGYNNGLYIHAEMNAQ